MSSLSKFPHISFHLKKCKKEIKKSPIIWFSFFIKVFTVYIMCGSLWCPSENNRRLPRCSDPTHDQLTGERRSAGRPVMLVTRYHSGGWGSSCAALNKTSCFYSLQMNHAGGKPCSVCTAHLPNIKLKCAVFPTESNQIIKDIQQDY